MPDPGADAGTLGADCRPAQAFGVASVELGGEVVLLDGAGRAHLLNQTGSMLWASFDGEATLGKIATRLAEAFSTSYERALADVCTFAGELAQQGMIASAP